MLSNERSREQGMSIYKLINDMQIGMYMSIGIRTVVVGTPDISSAKEVVARLNMDGWKTEVYHSRLSPGQYQIAVPLAY